ncbi:MAG: hypothetical protein WC332_02275 [Clostridia bacterium]|jgi:ABC-2 type transport system permease protein
MSNLFALLKADLINTYKLNGYKDPANRKKAIGMSLIALLVIAMSFLYIGGAALIISDILLSMQLMNILLIFAFALPFFALLIMDAYKMPSVLFSFKDYDMLMSLPIKDNTILAAKVLKLMFSGYVWQFLTSFPIFLVYCIKVENLSILTVIIYVILFLVMPLLPMSIGSVVGLALAKISSRMKSKNVIMIIGSFALLILIMGVSFSIQSIINEQALTNAVSSIADIESSFFLFKMYVSAVYGHNIVSLIILMLIFIMPFALFIYLFGKSFKKINSEMMETKASHSLKNVKYQPYSPVVAIFKKELRYYTHCVIYIVNTLFGMVLLFAASVAVLIADFDIESIFAELGQMNLNTSDMKLMAASLIFGYCIMLSTPTAASISLEGKNLWIIKSMPIHPKTIFKGKLGLGLIVTLPIGVISSILIYIGLGLSFIQWLILLGFTISAGFLASVLGLFINILLPKLEFKSPTEVVKQSASVGVTIFGGMFLVIIPMIIFSSFVVTNASIYVLIVTAIYILITISLWQYLITKGVKRFSRL